jgi:hypothetical protein
VLSTEYTVFVAMTLGLWHLPIRVI